MRCYHCKKDFSNRRDKGGYYAIESWKRKLIRVYCKRCSKNRYRKDWPVIIKGKTERYADSYWVAAEPAPNDCELGDWMRFIMRDGWTIL